MINTHRIDYQIEGYNFKGLISLETDSIGSSTCFDIANKFILEYFDRLAKPYKDIFKMTFQNKETISECSKLSVYLISDGSLSKEASEMMLLDVKNKIHEKIFSTA